MTILIVDDEYYIVKNIIESTNWSSLGITKTLPAYSARQARQVLESAEDVDILLTDIEMPRESGLELVSWAHENDFHPVTIVLTGHQRFDYAQAALNLHIFSYLLKPVCEEELMEKLTAAVQEVKRNELLKRERLSIEARLASDPSDILTTVKTYIADHLSSPDLNRNMIADEIHVNPDYLSNMFSKKEGTSLSSYIMDERLRMAKRLLATTNMPPQQICDQIGFSNVSYFYRSFKKSTGVTPQQYRENHQ